MLYVKNVEKIAREREHLITIEKLNLKYDMALFNFINNDTFYETLSTHQICTSSVKSKNNIMSMEKAINDYTYKKLISFHFHFQ